MSETPERIWMQRLSGQMFATDIHITNWTGYVRSDRIEALELKLKELQEEYSTYEREVKQREETFARKIGNQELRAETAEREVKELREYQCPAYQHCREESRAEAAEADKARLGEANRELHRRAQAAEGKLQRAEHAAREQIDILTSLATKLGHWPVGLSSAKNAMEHWSAAALSGSGSGWRLVRDGNPVTLDDCPEGLFLFNGYLGFISEYATDRNGGFRQRDAFCVDSGEYFWGGTSNARERAKLIVQPMLPAAPQQGGE